MSPREVSDLAIGSAEPVVGGRLRKAELAQMLARLAESDLPNVDAVDMGGLDGSESAELIDEIALLEQIKAAVAGSQLSKVVRFASAQVAEQLAQDVHPRLIGRGIGDQIGSACKVSPWVGSRRVGDARALWFDLPCTFAALRAGQISEYVATIVCRETSHLDQNTRRMVDRQLSTKDLPGLSPKRAAAAVRKLAYQADPQGAVDRARIEEKERRVSLQPAPDTMSILTGYLPAHQGVATIAALHQAADSAIAQGDSRSRGQIMADTLVERVTGQDTADDVNIELNLVMPLDTFINLDADGGVDAGCGTDTGNEASSCADTSNDADADAGAGGAKPAHLKNYGPIPAPLARALLLTTKGKVFLRRLFASPSGHLVGVDPRRRRFDQALATLIECRDQQCRDPFCDAPIRHLDHIQRHTDGGTTTLTNGRGECERGNYLHEMPGWKVILLHDGLGEQPHTVQVTTPTGHTYTSQAPQPP